ncbi:hypothetical protein BGW42_007515 [Actinomortierella wolfii]|nr:hypothetical protein BGW42_007515 [Actinomortierella wolfii]
MDALAPPPSSMGLYPQPMSPSTSNNVVVFEKTINVDEDVTLFFDTNFALRQDLTSVRRILRDQTTAGQELKKNLEQSQQATARVLQDAQSASKTLLDRLRYLESSALDMEEQMETSESFLTAKGNFGQRSVLDELTELKAKVQALEDAKKYILLVATAQRLVSESRQSLAISAEKALIPYGSLVELSKKIKSVTGGNQTKLDAYVSASADELLKEFKTKLSKKFQQALDSIGWPKGIPQPNSIPGEKRKEFERAFYELLSLQKPTFGDLDRAADKPYPPLLPLEILVAPLILRFRYHFEGKRPTNRIDKPEWYLAHVQGLIKEHSAFLHDYVQGILDSTEYKDYDVKNGFISLLLRAVENKIRQTVPQMLDTPELLSHAIHETIKFDTRLREEEYYVPPGQISEWQGCVQVYLSRKPWLMTWLQVEKDFATARYNGIMDEPTTWDPAYEDLGHNEYIIPTKSAEKIKDLLEIITDRYRPLSVLEQRAFLLDIQLDILNMYYRHIRGLVDQYESMTYSFVRNLPGAASQIEIDATGVDGLRKLCQWMSSIEYIKISLKEWSDDVFFIELYRDIRGSTQKNEPTAQGDLSLDILEDYREKELSVDGTLFDDAIKAYERLSTRIQDLIVRQFSELGGRQFARDVWQGIFGCGRRWIKKPENYHRKLRDASILLSLHSAKANSPPPLSLPTMAQDPMVPHTKRTLAQMMAVLFDDDQEQGAIQKKLEEIGVTHLSISEAREVVRRRVECWR